MLATLQLEVWTFEVRTWPQVKLDLAVQVRQPCQQSCPANHPAATDMDLCFCGELERAPHVGLDRLLMR